MAIGFPAFIGSICISHCIYGKKEKDSNSKPSPETKKIICPSLALGLLADLALFIIAAVAIVLITTQLVTLPYPKVWAVIACSILFGEPLILSISTLFVCWLAQASAAKEAKRLAAHR